jgi:hypothetical protein
VRLEAIHQQHRDRVAFLAVYIREAHASDEWALAINRAEHIAYAQPASLAGRAEVAHVCATALALTVPWVVDDLDDSAARAYAAWPDRLWVVDADGRVAFRGGPGPWMFDPEAWDRAIASTLEPNQVRR